MIPTPPIFFLRSFDVVELQDKERVQLQQLLHGHPLHEGTQKVGQGQTLAAAAISGRTLKNEIKGNFFIIFLKIGIQSM